MLRYFAGMSAAEIARACGVTESAAKMRVSRGLAKLRRILGATAVAVLIARRTAAARALPRGLDFAVGSPPPGPSNQARPESSRSGRVACAISLLEADDAGVRLAVIRAIGSSGVYVSDDVRRALAARLPRVEDRYERREIERTLAEWKKRD